MVERCVRDAEVGGSNPLTPTIPTIWGKKQALCSNLGRLLRVFSVPTGIRLSLRLELRGERGARSLAPPPHRASALSAFIAASVVELPAVL